MAYGSGYRIAGPNPGGLHLGEVEDESSIAGGPVVVFAVPNHNVRVILAREVDLRGKDGSSE